MNKFIEFTTKYWFTILQLVLVIVIIFSHLYKLDSVPQGLYLDESSIGVNAAAIANSGTDEFGTTLPLYFKAFGEYKNPVYIYTTAIVFKTAGISYFTLRFSSFIYFILALLFVYLLVDKMFKGNQWLKIYTLIGFGFLPHYFNISRVSFEVITQLAFTAFSLLMIFKVFHEKTRVYNIKFLNWINKPLMQSALLGLSIGFTIYTYSTARALSFLFLASIVVFYFKKENIKKLLTIIAFFTVALIPWVAFVFSNPQALTNRLTEISYISSTKLSLNDKVETFNTEYNKYFTTDFLVSKGDPNHRHTSGYDGLVYIPILILFFYGLFYLAVNPQISNKRFNLLLLANIFLSTIPAALTDESSPHSLRSLLLSLFIFLISCYGLYYTLKLDKKRVLAGLFIAFLVLESGLYLNDYFTKYPEKSKLVMGSYGLKPALEIASTQSNSKIVISTTIRQGKTLVDFEKLIIPNGQKINIEIGESKPVQNTCLVFHPDDLKVLNQSQIPYKELSDSSWFVGLRCY